LKQADFSLKGLVKSWHLGDSYVNHARILLKELVRSLFLNFIFVNHLVDTSETFLKIFEIFKPFVMRSEFSNSLLFYIYIGLKLVYNGMLAIKFLLLSLNYFFKFSSLDIECNKLLLQLIFASFL
jgi:hypothetical protein